MIPQSKWAAGRNAVRASLSADYRAYNARVRACAPAVQCNARRLGQPRAGPGRVRRYVDRSERAATARPSSIHPASAQPAGGAGAARARVSSGPGPARYLGILHAQPCTDTAPPRSITGNRHAARPPGHTPSRATGRPIMMAIELAPGEAPPMHGGPARARAID